MSGVPGRLATRLLALALALGALATSGGWFPEARARFQEWRILRNGFQYLGANRQGFPEYRQESTGIVFVRLRGGTFAMGTARPMQLQTGTTKDDLDLPVHFRDLTEEQPLHDVRLSPFLIAKHEVTIEQWRRFEPEHRSFHGSQHPVSDLSWKECRAFCEWAGLALPTEAQWEYACRAGSVGEFGAGIEVDGHGWYERHGIQPVGTYEPNAFGLHDMHGNVAEWCEDVYDAGFYSHPEASAKNPVCREGSAFRVLRGGSAYSAGVECRSAYRDRYRPEKTHVSLGLRPVLPLPD